MVGQRDFHAVLKVSGIVFVLYPPFLEFAQECGIRRHECKAATSIENFLIEGVRRSGFHPIALNSRNVIAGEGDIFHAQPGVRFEKGNAGFDIA